MGNPLLLDFCTHAWQRSCGLLARSAEELEPSKAALRNIAKMHAAYWCTPRRDTDLSWVNSFQNDALHGLVPLALVKAKRSLRSEYLRCFGQPLPHWLDELVEKLSSTVSQFVNPENDWMMDLRNTFTLVHGDYRRGNHMYVQDHGGELELLTYDLQTIHWDRGELDVSYYLMTSVKPNVIERHLP